MRSGVVSAGTWCVDLNKTIDAWPQEDTASPIRALERQNGGSGSNLATAIKRLDPALPVEAMGLVGDDDDGRFLLSLCDGLAIDRRALIATTAAPTFFTDCFNAGQSGKRTHLFFPGAGDLMGPEHFDFSATQARYLHLGLPGVHRRMDSALPDAPNGWVSVLRAARAAGLKTNLELLTSDPPRVGALGRACLPHLDVVIVNDVEAGMLAERETRTDGRADPPAILAALRRIVGLGPIAVAVSHFPEGAIAVSKDGAVSVCGSVAIPADEIAGVNGAGDSFAAGVLYGLHEGWAPERCLALGHASAAQSMREVPTTTGVKPWRECLAAAERWGYRPAPL